MWRRNKAFKFLFARREKEETRRDETKEAGECVSEISPSRPRPRQKVVEPETPRRQRIPYGAPRVVAVAFLRVICSPVSGARTSADATSANAAPLPFPAPTTPEPTRHGTVPPDNHGGRRTATAATTANAVVVLVDTGSLRSGAREDAVAPRERLGAGGHRHLPPREMKLRRLGQATILSAPASGGGGGGGG